MDLLKLLIAFSVLLAIYIITSWWSRSSRFLSKFSPQYHVLGCYASDTINDYSKHIKQDLQKLNSYEDKLENVDSIDLQWLDKLLPELSKKLQIFEKNYYESKADNVKSLLVEKKLEDAIREHELCLTRVKGDEGECEEVRRSEGEIKGLIDGHFGEIKKLNGIKKNLEEEFEREKLWKPAPQPSKPIVKSRDEEISRERTNLLNTRDRIRNLEKQRIILLERTQTNRDNLDRCSASHQLAKICETITATLQEFVDEQYHLASIQERIDMKTRQFKILKDAIQGCTSNCDETNRQADACRQELVHLIKLQAELREKEAKCKELCTKEQIEALKLEKARLDEETLRNFKTIDDANNEIKNYERKIRELEKQTIVPPPVNDVGVEPNQKLKKISDDIANVYRDIKEKHSSIQVLLNSLEAKDDKFSEHARNIEILNSCAVLREVAQKLARQVDEQSRAPGSQNRIELSKGELIKLLDTVRRAS